MILETVFEISDSSFPVKVNQERGYLLRALAYILLPGPDPMKLAGSGDFGRGGASLTHALEQLQP